MKINRALNVLVPASHREDIERDTKEVPKW